MTLLDDFAALTAQGIALVEAARTKTRDDLVGLGLSRSEAGSWLALADVFFGPTRRKALQRRAVEAARDGGLSVDALTAIVRHRNMLLEGDKAELLVELCQLRGTLDEINRSAQDRVRELNRAVADSERRAHTRRALKGGKNSDAMGLRTITITLPERAMARLLDGLLPGARRRRQADPKLRYEQAMLDELLAQVTRGGGAPASPLVPLVVVPVPDYAKLVREEGDDCVFALTNGTTITGAELVRESMADYHLVGLYEPFEGPINLYRSARTANLKQRLLTAAESIYCAVPGCDTPADHCETHHLKAWGQGGETNLRNLATVCRKHNALNDDDPNAPPRHGRLERIDGQIVFLPPNGGPPKSQTLPVSKRGAAGILRQQK